MENFDFTEVEKYLTVSLSRYQIMLPELWDDALQEGMIQAWRDVQDGVGPKLKVLRRAKLCARRYFNKQGQQSFGKPKTSRDGLRRDSTTINKVMTYLDEFTPVHDRMPTGKEVSQALGISHSSATLALKNIREGRIDHMKYHDCEDGSRRKDFDFYSTVSLDSLNGPLSEPESNNKTWEDNADLPFFGDQFESDTIAHIDLINVIKQLAPHHQKTLYLYLFEQYNTGDIGRELGHKKNPSQFGTKAVKNAVNQAMIVMDPYAGKCTAGHKRTEDNTTINQGQDGIFRRYCSSCRKKNADKTNASTRR